MKTKDRIEHLANTRLKHTDTDVQKYIELYESGDILTPLDVLHRVMLDYNTKDADVINAAKQIMSYTMNKTPVEKQVEIQEKVSEGNPRQELETLILELNKAQHKDKEEQVKEQNTTEGEVNED